MSLQERISQWVDAHEQELIRDITRLVAVKSVKGEPAPDAPLRPGAEGGSGRGAGALLGVRL